MRLRQTVDLDVVRADLVDAVQQAFEPAHVLVWLAAGKSTQRAPVAAGGHRNRPDRPGLKATRHANAACLTQRPSHPWPGSFASAVGPDRGTPPLRLVRFPCCSSGGGCRSVPRCRPGGAPSRPHRPTPGSLRRTGPLRSRSCPWCASPDCLVPHSRRPGSFSSTSASALQSRSAATDPVPEGTLKSPKRCHLREGSSWAAPSGCHRRERSAPDQPPTAGGIPARQQRRGQWIDLLVRSEHGLAVAVVTCDHSSHPHADPLSDP